MLAAVPAVATVPDATDAPTDAAAPTPEQAKMLAAMKQQLDAAARAIAAGHLDDAVRLARAAIATAGPDKRSVAGYEMLANALYQKHDVDGAIAALKRALEIDPTHGALYASLGGIAMNAGNRDQARQYLEQALKVTPDLPGAHERLGVLLEQAGDVPGAIREYEAGLLKTSPDYVGTKVALADLYNRTGRAAEAVRLLEPIVKPETSRSVPALMVLGAAYVNTKQLNKALPLLSMAQQLDRDDVRTGLALGAAQRMAGLNSASLDRLQQVVKAAPNSATARYELGLTYVALADYPAAREQLTLAAKIDDKSIPIVAMLGEVMLLQGKPDDAIPLFQDLVKRDGVGQGVYFGLATAYMAVQRPADAEAALRNAVARFPTDPVGYARLGSLLAQQGSYEAALKTLGEGNKIAPDDPPLLSDTALVQAQLGHPDDAIAVARHLVRVDPKGVGSRFLLANLLEANGGEKEAITIYRTILADAPDHADALNNLAWCLTDTGDAEAAVPLARRAAELRHDSADVADTLGWSLLHAGQTAEAVMQLKTANRLRHDDPTLLYHLAIAERDAGDRQAARAAVITALDLPGKFKDAGEARKLLTQLSE
jgi:tetratricopeptide (TPR) repeat protein